MGYGRIERFLLFTAAEWAASPIILHTYEAGLESDTGKVKYGDGLQDFPSLSYAPGFGSPGGGGDMLAANNLSDVADAQASRLNIMPSVTGNALKFLRINAGETDFEWVALAGGGDMLGANNLSDVANAQTSRLNILPSITGHASKLLRVNGAETDIEYFTATYVTSESDPVFSAWLAGPPDLSEFNNDVGFLTSETQDLNDVLTNGNTTGGVSMVVSVGDTITVPTAGLVIRDIDASHTLTISYETDLATNRVLSIFTGDANRALTIAGTTSISGTNTGDQTSIVGISGTKAQYNTSCSDGDFLFVGDVVGYTDELVDDRVSALIQNGTGITWSYDDVGNTLTPAVTITQYTDEMAQDATGAMCTDGSLVYTDATPLLKVAGGAVSFFLSGVQTDTTSTGNTDDYALNADVTELRFDSNVVNIALRSMVGGVEGRIVTVRNVHATCLVTISNDAGTGTAANKFYCHNTITLTQYYGATFKYNNTLQRWVLLAIDMVYTSSATDLLGSMVQPTIRTNAVTYSKMQDVSAASRLIGRGSASAGDPEEITLGTNLAMSTTTLNAQSVSTSGVGTSPTASQTDTITHGLGFTPKIIRIYGYGTFTSNAAATATTSSMGIWNSSGNHCVYQRYGAAITTTQAGLSSSAFAILLATGGGNYISGVIQNVTSTQFDIVWTETGAATAQVYMWEAE